MKTVVSALVALTVLAGAAGQALAKDSGDWTRDFWAQQERNLP